MKRIIVTILLSSIVLTGCYEETPKEKKEEVHTVAWFLEHQDVMNETLNKCTNNPGELLKTANCQNAIMAQKKLSIGKPEDIMTGLGNSRI